MAKILIISSCTQCCNMTQGIGDGFQPVTCCKLTGKTLKGIGNDLHPDCPLEESKEEPAIETKG